MDTTPAPAGLTIQEFARQVRLSRSAFYLIPDDAKPESVRIGKSQVILETPSAWLLRMKERGGLALRKASKVAA